ncbi:hypothetical protein FRC02_007838 [Tulasnella sp. 418]|nr:hypothetical protein FRC02_007838 [Tulasnella sp. 418]
MKLFVDPKPNENNQSSSLALTKSRIDRSVIEQTQLNRGLVSKSTWWDMVWKPKVPEKSKRVLWVVCGPEPMITDLAGSRFGRPKPDAPAGGVLGELGYKNSDVRKL